MGKKKGKGQGGDGVQKQPGPAQTPEAGPSQPQQQQQSQQGKKEKQQQPKQEQAAGDTGSRSKHTQPEQKISAGPGGDAKKKQEHPYKQQSGQGGPQQGQSQRPHGDRGGYQQGGQQQPHGPDGQHQQRDPPQQHQAPPQQQHQQRGPWPQQQRGPGPQQYGPPGFQGPPQQRGAWPQQQGPPGFRQRGAWPQQQGPPGFQQRGAWPQQQGPSGPQQQQRAPWPQQQGPPGPQQQQRAPLPQQQGPPGPQQQQRAPLPQQQGPPGPQQQQRAPWPQQQHGPRAGPPQREQEARGAPQQQQQKGAWGGQKQHGGQQQQQRGGQRQQHGPEQKQQEQTPRASPQHQPRGSEERQLPVLPRAMAKMKIDEFKPSNIPVQTGSLGRKTIIESNYLDLDIKNLPDEAWQYDVVIDPDKPKKFLRLVFNEFSKPLQKRNIFLAFDGSKIAFSNTKVGSDLLGGAHEVQIIEPDTQKPRKYKVTMKEADFPLVELKSLKNYKHDRIFDKPMRAVQCLDVVLRSAPADAPIATRAGRNFYVKPKDYVDLDDGYELWLGLFQACVLGDRPLLNIDVCHKAFPSDANLLDVVGRNCDPRRGLDRRGQENVLSLIKGIDVSYQDPSNPVPKRFKVFGLGNTPSRQMFEKEGTRMSVLEYFTREKKVQLKFPDLPCVMVSQGRVALPMEFCRIPGGQATNKKAGERQVRAMIKSAATTTTVRKNKILDLYRLFQHDQNPIIRSFKVTIGKEFLKLQARILDAPNLEYASMQLILPQKGSWEVRGKRFIEGQSLIKWAILILDKYVSEYDVRRFKELMVKEGGRLNMKISDSPEVCKEIDDRRVEDHMQKFKKAGMDLVLVVISQFRDSYSKVKQPAEIRCGVLTQCIKGQTIQKRCNQSTVHNILLKVNAKLNGMNHKISKGNYENVMFLGADVTHPSPDQSHIPSVVGLAATHDRVGFKYNMRFRLQDPKQEMIQDMEMLLKEQLLYYKECNKTLPQKIVYYRDGVSDGQFEQVRQIELNAMERAVAQVQQGYKPLITCVIVQKRHHTRFFPIEKTADSFNNVNPGTVVDSMITHPAENQFFLVSHESIQGVAKPSKYCLIRDDSKFNINELQSMTYNLCHMFTRCNRSVSYPAPAYYAHLAAARGRVYIEGAHLNLHKLDFENKQRSIRAEIYRDRPMFFV